MSRVIFGKNAEQAKWFRLESLLQDIAAHRPSDPSIVPDDPAIDPQNSVSDIAGVVALSSQTDIFQSEFIDLIRQRAAQTPPGNWIQTSAAWHEVNLVEGRLPTAPELDQATRDHPVLVRRGGHVVVANSLAVLAT